jgi:hypothetical protein
LMLYPVNLILKYLR